MSQTTNEWKLGLFVVSCVGVAVGALLWLGAARFDQELIEARTYLDESVQGLDPGSPVKFRGVTIGTVSAIGIAPDLRRVEVVMRFDKRTMERLGLRRNEGGPAGPADPAQPFVPVNVRVQLASSGITGVRFLLVDLFDPRKVPLPELPFVVPREYIPAAPSTLKSIEDLALLVVERLPPSMKQIEAILGKTERLLTDIDAKGLSRRTQGTLKAAERTLKAVEVAIAKADVAELSSSTRTLLARVDETLGTFDALGREVREDGGPLRGALGELERAGEALRKAVEAADVGATTASVRGAGDAVAGLARDGRGLEAEVRQAVVALREAAEAVRLLASQLERDPGAVLHGRTRDPGPGGR